MRVGNRLVFGLLVVVVIAVAWWLGGAVLMVGVGVFGVGYLLKLFLGWKSYKQSYGVGEETFGDFLGLSTCRPRQQVPKEANTKTSPTTTASKKSNRASRCSTTPSEASAADPSFLSHATASEESGDAQMVAARLRRPDAPGHRE